MSFSDTKAFPPSTFDPEAVPGVSSALDSSVQSDNNHSLSSKTRRFCFDIGDISFLVEEGVYCELLVDSHITPLPNAPQHVAGLINLRGNIIPVYSLSAFVGIEQARYKYAYLIGEPEQGAALLINDKPRLVDLTERHATETKQGDLPELILSCSHSSYSIESQRWFSLEHDLLFSKLATPV